MLQAWELFLVSTAYVALLFGIAWLGDRRGAETPSRARPWIHSLALGVYCTSWTFYGAVGSAAANGWQFLPIYLGPTLAFVLGYSLLRRIVAISKRDNITSIADFIGARYGRHQPLSMLVTLVAIIGVVPYISLQLKAVDFSFDVLTGSSAAIGIDNALPIAALLALFSILFGTRHVASSENHHGMVLAIAFESVIKLLALLAVGLYACYGVGDGFIASYGEALSLPQLGARDGELQLMFAVQTLLAAAAIICLPRQFHVLVVENTGPADLRRARWVFPLYMGLISLFVLPIAAAGLRLLPAGTVPDTFVLALPMAQGQELLTLVAYIGGFSAATSMVIVATIALSTMLCNELVMPLLLRWRAIQIRQKGDLGSLLKLIRRLGIVAIVTMAYFYYYALRDSGTLASMGLLSFTAVAQFAPALIGGLYWRGGSYPGAMAGLMLGFLLWIYTLLFPTLAVPLGLGDWLGSGPGGIAWLRPQGLFGTAGLPPLAHSLLWSLGGNVAAYVLVSRLARPGLRERLQSARFLEYQAMAESPAAPAGIGATVGDLQALLERFFGRERAAEIVQASAREAPLLSKDRATAELLRHTEHLLAGALGNASARLVLAHALRGRDMQLEDVIRLLDESSSMTQFNRAQLRATVEHLPHAVRVIDNELRLVAWNRRYVELFGLPPELMVVGRPLAELLHHSAARAQLGMSDADTLVTHRLAQLHRGKAHSVEFTMLDGTVLDIRGNPMPGGGFITSYIDITAYKRTAEALQEANETLESRVEERTRELTELNAALAAAKADVERAYEAKTRVLASASHDLAQPINAARLFVSSIERDRLETPLRTALTQAENSLASAESLISSLLEITRLDARAQQLRREHFSLQEILDPLAAEFRVLAQRRGLELRYRPCRTVVNSDPALLRRVLQNLLGNAVRYTQSGGILLACRGHGSELRIEVWDTGPGISPEHQALIFEEFRRIPGAQGSERGLGLGLAIVDRLTNALQHPCRLRSRPGRGSVFSVEVPRGEQAQLRSTREPRLGQDRVAGSRVLCIENEPAVLAGLTALLESWTCQPMAARNAREAAALYAAGGEVPDLMLLDYHLDNGEDGVSAGNALRRLYGNEVPGIVVTADHAEEARTATAGHGYALLPKPLKPAALRALMGRLLQQRSG